MLMRRIAITLVAAAAWLVITPADAQAQMTMGAFKGYLTGHVGGIAGDALTNEDLVLGASMSVQEERGWGAEIDFDLLLLLHERAWQLPSLHLVLLPLSVHVRNDYKD